MSLLASILINLLILFDIFTKVHIGIKVGATVLGILFALILWYLDTMLVMSNAKEVSNLKNEIRELKNYIYENELINEKE